MNIDLKKGDRSENYFYSKNNVTCGPYSLADIIKYIDKNTLVYVEGIGWKKAKNFPEINVFLKSESKSLFRIIIIIASLLLIIACIVFIRMCSKNEIEKAPDPIVDTIITKEPIVPIDTFTTSVTTAGTKEDSIERQKKEQEVKKINAIKLSMKGFSKRADRIDFYINNVYPDIEQIRKYEMFDTLINEILYDLKNQKNSSDDTINGKTISFYYKELKKYEKN